MALCNTEFQRDAVAFLAHNAIALDFTGCASGLNQFVIEDHGEGIAKVLRQALATDPSSFAGYYLPYGAGQTFQITLGSGAQFMFTEALTGCSFFVDRKWTTPTVSHINRQTAAGGIDQPAIDTSATAVFGSAKYSGLHLVANYLSVKKDDYTPTGESPQDNRLYVVGVRKTLGWYLYRMKHDPMTAEVIAPPTRIN